MVHRDEQEAARQRIDALERDLADARAEAASAKADAARARLEQQPRPAKAQRKQAPERKAKRRTPQPRTAASPTLELQWEPGARLRFSRSIGVLAGVAYGGAAAAWIGVHTAGSMELLAQIAGAAVGTMLVGAPVLAKIHHAPGPFGAALVTLLLSPLVLSGVAFSWSDQLWAEVLSPGPVLVVVQALASLLAVGLGVAASVSWITDAASSPIQADP